MSTAETNRFCPAVNPESLRWFNLRKGVVVSSEQLALVSGSVDPCSCSR
jgi:hypothetical protein